jgi:hypothetical protein
MTQQMCYFSYFSYYRRGKGNQSCSNFSLYFKVSLWKRKQNKVVPVHAMKAYTHS